MNKKIARLKAIYGKSKTAIVGETCVCPSCGETFIKSNHQQAFCKTKGGTICKDNYWNNITPTKRNNITRISPASAAYLANGHSNEWHGEDNSQRYEDCDWGLGWDGHKD